LETLSGLGYLDTYLNEIKPISRVEGARLTLEAQDKLADSNHSDPLARNLIHSLAAQLSEEIGWLDRNSEDNQATMIHPAQRLEAEYLFSRGQQRRWRTTAAGTASDAEINAEEVTPLLPNNDGLPTAAGSNESARWSGWAGLGGFLTGYGEAALAGPLTRGVAGISRLQPLGSAVVVSLGNSAISFGTEEMRWGTGHFETLTQSDNASPFPAIRLQNIHPTLLPGFLAYLGQFRFQIFFGQLDGDRYFAHPWLDGEIFSFKPLPTFEIGFTHTIDFGGVHNDNYSTLGFLGRATGFATGNPVGANTHSRGGAYLKFNFPDWRHLEIYQEIAGQDNLTYEISGIGRFLPFLSVSYQGGFYLPRLSQDGLTDMRFEYALLEPNDSVHGDSLYWTYEGQLMGDALGPNATQAVLEIGHWLNLSHKLSVDALYTERAPTFDGHRAFPVRFYPYTLGKEHSAGLALDLVSLPRTARKPLEGLAGLRARAAVEYVRDLNYETGRQTVRFLFSVSASFQPGFAGWEWN
jgi:hypothetical protein